MSSNATSTSTTSNKNSKSNNPHPERDKNFGKPLDKGELSRLYMLGYKKADIQAVPVETARSFIKEDKPKPGTRAWNKKNGNALPDRYTDEAIEERNATKAEPSGVYVIQDEFTNRCIKGDDPIDATLNAYADANPGMRIRLVNPDLPPTAGPQFQPISGAERIGGLVPSFMPEEIYQEAFVKPNLRRSKQMMGEFERPKPDPQSEADQYAPIEGRGFSIQPNLNQMS